MDGEKLSFLQGTLWRKCPIFLPTLEAPLALPFDYLRATSTKVGVVTPFLFPSWEEYSFRSSKSFYLDHCYGVLPSHLMFKGWGHLMFYYEEGIPSLYGDGIASSSAKPSFADRNSSIIWISWPIIEPLPRTSASHHALSTQP